MEPFDLFGIAALAMILVYALGSVIRLWDSMALVLVGVMGVPEASTPITRPD